MKVKIPCALMLILCTGQTTMASYQVLHNFVGGTSDGASPGGSLVKSGSTLYGLTQYGGSTNKGVVFKVGTDGTGFGVMHSFVSGGTDGQRPMGSLLLSESQLYGMAGCVGSADYRGTVFRISTDGTGFQVLRSFSGADGKWPYGDLTGSGSVLYGMNTYGGNNTGSLWVGAGTVFRLNTDGTGFQVLHIFTGNPGDGCGPHGSLTQCGSVLYGMTMVGGTNDIGTIFRINSDGTGYQLLHTFTGTTTDGAVPYLASLIELDSVLFGMTYGGGSSNNGTIFRMNTDGTGFQVLHSFTGGRNDGWQPYGSLILSGSTLYGMTETGGANSLGTIFQINTDGTGFAVRHSFNSSTGSKPWGSLLLDGSMLYGMTSEGGSANKGVIFALDITPDTAAPTPNPMTWAVVPHGAGLHSIGMTATTAIDESGVQYLFSCTSGPGHSSAWQTSPIYTDTGLAEGATCSYTVKARDKSPAQNETAASVEVSASALLDTTAPTPNPMTWATAPAATGLYDITMTATAASDISGVEYFFQNITDESHFSGWQDSTAWTDANLSNGTTYTYHVKARDRSLTKNETAWSDPNSATTISWLCTAAVTHDLNNDCRVDFMDLALMASGWGAEQPLTNNIVVNGTLDTDMAPGWQLFELPTATGTYFSLYDGGVGNPAGSVAVVSDSELGYTAGHYVLQVIPVTVGDSYRLSGQWMGDLTGLIQAHPESNIWAHVLVMFQSSPDANSWDWSDAGAVMYGKSFGTPKVNVDSTGTWPTWEPLTNSVINGPNDGVFTAIDSYMVVAFDVGGTVGAGAGYYYFDNIKVEGPACADIDLNGDCRLDMNDLAVLGDIWLTCNRDPVDTCW